MAVKIRLSRLGRNKVPFYRVIACDEDSKRDGRNLEILGTYNTLTNPATINLKEDRVKYWIGVGATPTATAAQVIEKQIPGWYSEIVKKRTEKIRAARSKRKARTKAKGGKPAAAAATKATKAKSTKKAATAQA